MSLRMVDVGLRHSVSISYPELKNEMSVRNFLAEMQYHCYLDLYGLVNLGSLAEDVNPLTQVCELPHIPDTM